MGQDSVDKRGLRRSAYASWMASSKKRTVQVCKDNSYGINSFVVISDNGRDAGAAVWIGKIVWPLIDVEGTTASLKVHSFELYGGWANLLSKYGTSNFDSTGKKKGRLSKDVISRDCVTESFPNLTNSIELPARVRKLIICDVSIAQINNSEYKAWKETSVWTRSSGGKKKNCCKINEELRCSLGWM